MTRLMIWGTSDDLVDVDVVCSYPDNLVEIAEYGCYDTSKEVPVTIHLSDGTVLGVWYGDGNQGIWRVEILHQGSANVVIVPAENEDGIYSDIAFVTGPNLRAVKAVYRGEVLQG